MYILTKQIHGVQFYLTSACLTKSEGWKTDFSKSRRDAIQFSNYNHALALAAMCDETLVAAPYKRETSKVKAEVEV